MSKMLRLTMVLWMVLAPAVGPAWPESRRTIPDDPETTRVVRLADEALDRRDIAAAVREGQRSIDGVLRVADAFARLGDRDVVAYVVRIAGRLADRAGDPAASERVGR